MKQRITTILLILLTANAIAQSGKSPTHSVYISNIPKPNAPANLIISSFEFNDKSTNNVLDANEEVELSFVLSNQGKGDAYRVIANINSLRKINGLSYPHMVTIGDIEAGNKQVVKIRVKGAMNLESSKITLEILVTEGNAFDADPFSYSFDTQAFKLPQVSIVDHKFTTENGGNVKLGQLVSLGFVVQNKGQGVAKDINISVKIPSNVYPAGDSDFSIYDLKPNESKPFHFEFFANKKYIGNEISIEVVITESYKKYGDDKVFKVLLEESLSQTQKINISAQYLEEIKIEDISLTSDVDKNIPENNSNNENSFALIIGNKDYSKDQRNISSESDVPYANNDAIIFKQYLIKTFGFPANNVSMEVNATAGRMSQAIDKLNKLIKATNGKANVVVYYAGHGLPDETTKEPYLIPVDVSGSNIASAIKLSSMYKKLTEHPSQQITVFLDACFSGGARDQGLLATRGVRIKPKEGNLKGNIVVFAASSGEESSLAWKQKQHGMFTYFLLKKFQSSKGKFSYAELDRYLKDNVGLESVRTNSKSQTPQVMFSPQQKESWGELRIK